MSKFFTTEISDPFFESDNLRYITVKSKALNRRADITVYVPTDIGKEVSVDMVILLHGVYASHWAWTRLAGVHKMADKLIEEGKIRPMVLVMPSDGLFGDGSGYLTHQNEDYEKWIVEDVIQVVKEQIALVTDNSSVFIAGFSMGGYGALRLGAKYPTVFKTFSGLSSITELNQLIPFLEGEDKNDLFKNALPTETVFDCLLANKETLPLFRFDCGTEDSLLEFNQELHIKLTENNINHIYKEAAGEHEWDYWQNHIADILLFFNEFDKNR